MRTGILIYGTDMERLKAAGAKIRSRGIAAHIRDSSKFQLIDLEPSYAAVILLDPNDVVKGAYEAYNSRVSDDKKLEIREEYEFEALTSAEMAEVESRPHWQDMTVKELLEYAFHNFGVKIIGSTKREIIERVDALWRQERDRTPSVAVSSEDPNKD
jgi:hypothetical protein